MVQQYSLALIKPRLFCLYRPQFSGYIMPLKILVLSTQLSKPPPKKTLQIILNQLNQNIARITQWSSA